MIDSLSADWILRNRWRSERRCQPDDPTPAPISPGNPELRESVQDHLRLDSLQSTLCPAMAAACGGTGEPLRRTARALAWAASRETQRDLDEELGRIYQSLRPPIGGFVAQVRGSDDPELQSLARDRLARWLDRAEEYRCEGRSALDELASKVGALGWTEVLDRLRPMRAAAWHSQLERGWIQPLDDTIASGGPTTTEEPTESASRTLMSALSGLDRLWGNSEIEITRAASGICLEKPIVSLDPVTPGIELQAVCDVSDWMSALESAGRIWRHRFLAAQGQISQALWGDPALDAANSILFQRLALNPTFVAECGGVGAPWWSEAMAWQSAVDPRRFWTYLGWELDGIDAALPGFGGDPDRHPDVGERFRRSQGRGMRAEDVERAIRERKDPAAQLRGWCFALLLEDRWLRRYGRGWYQDGRAIRELQECWDGESGETVETMAAALGLGTIEPTPLADRCRPTCR